MGTIGFDQHNHSHCNREALKMATDRCLEHRPKFTPVRRRVLEMRASDRLGPQPPVVYRALDFLVRNGLAHRIERLNAYTACAHPDHAHAPAFLICRSCRTVAEAEGLRPSCAGAGA